MYYENFRNHIICDDNLCESEIEYYKNIFKKNKKIRLLSEDSVKYIKYLIENNFIKSKNDTKKIRTFFNISYSNLSSIKNSKNWKNVKSEFNEEIDREFNYFN